jgi:hypothetical protein
LLKVADPFVVSWWVKKELGYVESMRVTRSGLVITVSVSVGQRENALVVKRMGARKVTCFVLKIRAPMKGVITWVAVNIKVDQLRGKIPSVCDARHLMRRRQGGKSGETEESLSVLLSFEVESLPDKVKLGDINDPVQAEYITMS